MRRASSSASHTSTSARSARRFVNTDRGVARKDREVLVGVKNRGCVPESDCTYETVDQLADSLAAVPARAIQRGGHLVVAGFGGQGRGPSEQASQALKVPGVASAGEDFHAHGIADRDVVAEQPIDLVAYRRSGVAKELDPRRGVDEDHAERL